MPEVTDFTVPTPGRPADWPVKGDHKELTGDAAASTLPSIILLPDGPTP